MRSKLSFGIQVPWAFMPVLLATVPAPPAVFAQQITRAQMDSGWVSAFDGKTLNGFYTILGSGAPNNDPDAHPDGTFSVRASDSSIHATGTPAGHIVTKKLYSHYRVRIQEKFDNPGDSSQNAGMLYHLRIEGPRLFNTYPRSIEYQGQKRGMGEIWTIGNVYVNTTVDPTMTQHKYKPGGKAVTHGDPDGRQCLASSNPYVDGAWNTMEALVRGSDSAVHIVNGVTVFRCWKMRWSETDDPADMANMLASGSIGLQSEGSPVSYRNYMFMELDPATGKPVNGKTTLAGSFPAARKGDLLRAEARDGGWTIRYALSAPGRLSIHSLDGRLIGELALPGSSGEVFWRGSGLAAGGPLIINLGER